MATTIEAHSACCPTLNLHSVRGAVRRLVSGDGCRWCLAYTVIFEMAAYAVVRDPPKAAAGLLGRIMAILDTEPGPTSCPACLRARRATHQPHSNHALCENHA